MDDQQPEQNNKEQTKARLLKELEEFKDSAWVFLVRKSKLTFLIVIALLVFGFGTIFRLPKELNPEVQIPFVIVVTAYPGASPLDMEEQVTKELETELTDLSGVKRMDSTSSLGLSTISIEFEAGEDIDKAMDEVKDKVDKVKSDLPEDATEPEVIEAKIDDQPVLEAVLASDNYDVSELKKFAEDLKDKLKGVPFTSDIVVVGGSDEVFKIEVDQEKLSANGISSGRLLQTLQAANVNFPLGSIEVGNSNYNVRVEGKFKSASELAALPIGQAPNGKGLYLEDVAKVSEGFRKENSRSRFSTNGSEPQEAVSLQVYKRTGGDVTKMTEQARQIIFDAKGNLYPEDITLEITNDFSAYIIDSITTLTKNGLQTVLLILLLLFIFLGWREALLAGPAIPLSFLIAFILMDILDESINFVSLFSLILSLGILVDAAVVVVEGMYAKVAHFGMNGYQAAVLAIKEYAAPLMSGTLTTMAAFFPLLFVEGIFGQFMSVIPKVVICTLAAGLFVAISVVPAIGTYLMKPIKPKENGNGGENGKAKKFFKKMSKSKPRKERWASRMFEKIADRYRKVIPHLLASRRSRLLVVLGCWGFFLVSMALPISGFLKIEAFGKGDEELFYVNLEMPDGTVLEKTDEVTKKIEEELRKEPEITNFVVNIGASMGAEGSGTRGSERAFIQVNLTGIEERKVKSYEIVSDLRKRINPLVTEGKVTFVEIEEGPPAGEPIELRIVGDDLLKLEEIGEEIKKELENTPTIIDADTSMDFSAGEFVFYPDKEILARRGLTVWDVASSLRSGVARDDDLKITRDGEEVKFDFGFDEKRLTSAEDIKGLTLTNGQGEIYAVSELGEIKFESALSSVKRRDSERVIVITAATDGGNAAEITKELQSKIAQMDLPKGYRAIFGGESEELQAVYIDMLLKMFLGIVLILFILVLQFNSYRQTLIILFSIPLALIGVFWGMAIFRLTLDIPAFIGIVSLSGIVVNDAIILIDQINRDVRRGKRAKQAAADAGRLRLQPVFLTTVTTVIGLVPLALSNPMWKNLGFAIIFGLSFASLLTLFVVPTMYVSLHGDNWKNYFGFIKWPGKILALAGLRK